MGTQLLQTEDDYNEALAIASKLVDAAAKPGMTDRNRLGIMTGLIELLRLTQR
ncbi:hypothetical protein K6V72_15000 [Ralstonia insidiosa]|jgi:hypothetical protein|uniref:hypothetical protein n=1 Tax=Ralstonia insidiosa TaxID=190721 RepID=UPI000A45E68C|nr:hypothetical protein [Ralstonia insidiosa]MBY4910314.1 hypothetical protein [Ralstonia insidiosa]